MTDDRRQPPPGALVAAGGGASPAVVLPSSGVFAQSEVMVAIRQARDEMWRTRSAWIEARTAKDEAKAHARKTRADLIVRLRVFGNEGTDGVPIKTSAERNEWADADAAVQRAELDADLAQTLAMTAYEAYQDAQALFQTLQGILGIERDDMKMSRRGE